MIKNNITAIVIVLAAVLALAIIVIIYLFLRIRRTEAECDLLVRGAEGKNFVEIVNDNIGQVEGLLDEVDALSERYAAVLRRVAGAVQHVGVVRFDAFRDLGGMLSFAVALLDDRGNGLVFSSIYGRSDSRTYAKPVIERNSTYELSPEEKEAIRLAMQGRDMGALPVEARDRDHEEKIATLKLFHDKDFVEPGRSADEPRPTRAQRETPRAARQAAERESGIMGGEEWLEPAPGEGRRQAEPERPRAKRGRAQHVRQAERPPKQEKPAKPERPAGKPERAEEEPPERPVRRPYDREIDRLVDEAERKPREERPALSRPAPPAENPVKERPERPERPAPEAPAPAPRPRGLNTPVERLRDRERKGGD